MLESTLPSWAEEVASFYQSGAYSQFVLYGNVNDRMLLPGREGGELGGLRDYLVEVLMPGFDVVLSYDIGNGIRIERGGEALAGWPRYRNEASLPREPGAAIAALTQYFRYCANLAQMGQARLQIGCFVQGAHLVAPAVSGGLHYEVSSLAMLIRDWATDSQLTAHPLATFLISENLNDLNALIVNNPRAARVRIPLPSPEELALAMERIRPLCPIALERYSGRLEDPARRLAGATLSTVESLLKHREYRREPLRETDLARLKKELVERDANGLIEFLETDRTLDDLQGLAGVKAWLRDDLALWRQDDLDAVPKGYLLCGPVGTGKTFLVECLAGEAGLPVVKLKNFRDKWVGSSEGNLEKIFRLLHALGRCYVFIDEADQALGRRGAGGDTGVSGRLYSMMAEEMSRPENRGRIVWVLASSRPDLIEVDLKRPGRVDVKVPLLPAATPREVFELLRALCAKRDLVLPEDGLDVLSERLPRLLTPAAAEVLAVKVYRRVRTRGGEPLDVLADDLEGYRPPVPAAVMDRQVRLAIAEASDPSLVPAAFLAPAGE